MSQYLIFVSIFFLMACNATDRNNISSSKKNDSIHIEHGVDRNNISSSKKNDSIHIEHGVDTKSMTIEVVNNQENSSVFQNDAININERGSIRIGN